MTILAILAAILVLHGFRLLGWNKASFSQTKVEDGDSIRITGNKATLGCRLVGYDAPEWNQDHGRQAAAALRALLANGYKWRLTGYDDYGRGLIEVRNAKGSIARQMIAAGHGHNAARWGVFEIIAKITRRGLWRNPNAMHPAVFRVMNSKR